MSGRLVHWLVCWCLMLGACAVTTGYRQPPTTAPSPAHTPHAATLTRHGSWRVQLRVAVAFPASQEALVTRAVNRTLTALSADLSSAGLALSPIYHPLPPPPAFRLAASLAALAAAWSDPDRSVVAVLVFAPDGPGLVPALAATALGLPVLWATSQVNSGYLDREPLGPLEVRLDAGQPALFRGLRSLLLATHWHSFTLVHTGLPLRRDTADVLRTHPLSPRFVPLRPDASRHAIFSLLSDVSHLTKGVVVLMSDGGAVQRLMAEAKRLNMVEGDYVWLWVDTSASVSASNDSKISIFYPEAKERWARHSGDDRSNASAAAARDSKVTSTSLNGSVDFDNSDNVRVGSVDSTINGSNSKVSVEADSKSKPISNLSESSSLSSNVTVTSDYVWVSDDKLRKRVGEVNSNKVRDNSVRSRRKRGAAKREVPPLPVGMLGVRALPLRFDRQLVRSAVRLLVDGLRRAVHRRCHAVGKTCWREEPEWRKSFARDLVRELRAEPDLPANGSDRDRGALTPRFQILNLVPDSPQPLNDYDPDTETSQVQESRAWRAVGDVVGQSVHLDTIVWPGGRLMPVSASRGARSMFRVVTALAPPFVMEGELDEDGQCLRGLECHRLLTSDKDNLTLVFNEMDRLEDEEEEQDAHEKHFWAMDSIFQSSRYRYRTNCCYGISMDLLENVAEELEFGFHLYIVSDEAYGTRVVQPNGEVKWNGVVGDLVSGAAHMSFSALSVSSPRSQVVDFSAPYFFSGVSMMAAPKQHTDIPLLAFLLPFSPELWIAIFTSLNVTAVAVAIYEWLSPFGLNPWGRQRSKNFSMSSALWVCWALLCGHLVAFKAPKSWPNKFLINVWGGFSVIFVASYTANIAALIAGLFFHNAMGEHNRNMFSQRVGAPRASAAEYYVHKYDPHLWDNRLFTSVKDIDTGVQLLKNGTLDILIADTPILDYYRATDHGCKLQKIGETMYQDAYAIGMAKGFPLKDSISEVIAKYSSNGYMDILQEKWYGGLPCFKIATDMAQPRPLGVDAVTGVFLLLGMGMIVGCLILFIEHLFYRYTLPILRHKPKGTIWRSRNIMFFSQKLYRFINCVELVSPHHAARELVHTLRQGQITSLFQKSVKRKEHEQRRRRKSKAQFFEMIQEIRRVQQEEKVVKANLPLLALPEEKSPRHKKNNPADQNRRHSRLDLARRLSKDVFKSKSSSNLSIRRLSSDINIAAGRFLDCHSSQAIGRRLSRDTNLSPPDINSRRASHLSISRKPSSQFLSPSDVDLSAPSPHSPNLDTSLPASSMRLLPTLPRSPDYNASARFRYVDVKSPSFKTKLSRYKEPLQEGNPKVIIHGDTEESETTKQEGRHQNSSEDGGTEHLIEIVIPPEDYKLNPVGQTLQGSRSLTGLSVLEQITTLAENQTRPHPPPKPKIVSYLPKKHRKPTNESRRINNGKSRKRSSSDTIIRTDEVHSAETDNCNDTVFSPSGSTNEKTEGSETGTPSRLSQEQELRRQLMEAIRHQSRDPP